jgi:hypothetical protein
MVIEPSTLILKEKHELRVPENRMPRRVFQAMRGNVTKE